MSADERNPGEAFCSDCPDHEGCMTGYPCDLVKSVNPPCCRLCGGRIKVMAFRRDGFCCVLHKREYEAQHPEE